MKLALSRPKKPSHAVAIWSSALPFVENSRAVLIHRPRYVCTYNLHKHPHIAVNYLCGNGSTGWKNFTFLEQCPEHKLLCARCEEAASAVGLPSAYSICGRHVHLGRTVAVQTCCQEPRNGS